jgi:riboflavin kinase/FMN adenylyltransferase
LTVREGADNFSAKMQIFRHFSGLPSAVHGGAVAIGNFDGVHLGHRAVIQEAGRIARSSGAPWGVLTFEPHPRAVFTPTNEPFVLTPYRMKAHHVAEMGVDFLVVLHFDLEFAKRTAEQFVTEILVGGLEARHVVSGFDFGFGRKREGNGAYLAKAGQRHGFASTTVPAVNDDTGEPVSSTRIRELLVSGDPRGAAELIGRAYEIEGRVVPGDQRARGLGVPTANIVLDKSIHPAIGIYAVRAGFDRGAETVWHDGVSNFGYRPTLGAGALVFETHLFDFTGDLYGRHLRIALVDFLRPEVEFTTVEALKAQIDDDCREARRRLAG